MQEKNLEKCRQYVRENFARLLKTYRDKYLLVSDGEVVGSFDTYEKAAEKAIELYGPEGNFLVQFITDEQSLNFVLSARL